MGLQRLHSSETSMKCVRSFLTTDLFANYRKYYTLKKKSWGNVQHSIYPPMIYSPKVSHTWQVVVQDIKYTNYNSLFPFSEFFVYQGIVWIKSSFKTETIAGFKGCSRRINIFSISWGFCREVHIIGQHPCKESWICSWKLLQQARLVLWSTYWALTDLGHR